MRFGFLHIADAHIGGRFAGLARRSEAAAAHMATACLDALSRAVDVALERQAAFVVIAGDLFDQAAPDLRDSFAAAERLAPLARGGTPIFWLLGNHDHKPAAKELPNWEGLRRFSTKRVETFELPALNTALHGRSFSERAAPENFARDYPRAQPGRFEIGVLHTSLDGREGASTYAPCAVGDLKAAGYDYWALGHVHTREIVSEAPWIVFPGCLQGRNPRETGEKGCVFVEVEDGVVAGVEPIACDGARWLDVSADVHDAGGASAVDVAFRGAFERAMAEADGRPAILRVRLRASETREAALRRRGQAALLEQAARTALEIDERIIVEAVRIETAASAPAPSGLSSQLAELVAEAAQDPALIDALRAEFETIRRKADGAQFFDDPRFSLEKLLAAGRSLALADPDAAIDDFDADLDEVED